MDPKTSAAVARISELKSLVANNKQTLNDLDQKITQEATSFEGTIDQKYTRADQALSEAKQAWAGDHAADIELTEHFAETANRQCLDTLQDQNDETLDAERTNLHRSFNKVANQELTARAAELREHFEEQLAETLQTDGDTHARRLESMILGHKEAVDALKAQLPK